MANYNDLLIKINLVDSENSGKFAANVQDKKISCVQ